MSVALAPTAVAAKAASLDARVTALETRVAKLGREMTAIGAESNWNPASVASFSDCNTRFNTIATIFGNIFSDARTA